MFTNSLDLRATDPGEWALIAPLHYGDMVVPVGFITDLASIPRPFRPILDRTGKSRKPAVLHDFLYCQHKLERSEADWIFLEALESEGVSLPVRWAMYLAVRAGGWAYWDKRDGMTMDDFDTAEHYAAALAAE